ncbi:MAG: hypothetical protein QOH33_1956, partial [Paraburkholderia sp.]|nr:hypothetical protein [Paraburkholderia sp.]
MHVERSIFEATAAGEMPPARKESRRVGLALFHGFALQAAATVVEVFQAANTFKRAERCDAITYDVCLLSVAGGRIASSSSVFVWTESVETCRHADGLHALFIVGGVGVTNALRDERMIRWFRRAYPRSALVFPSGDGRLLLEAAGFGETASVVNPGLAAVNDTIDSMAHAADTRDFMRSALAVVTEDLGEEAARQIAKVVVAPPPQTEFSAILRKNVSVYVSAKIRESARWLEANG